MDRSLSEQLELALVGTSGEKKPYSARLDLETSPYVSVRMPPPFAPLLLGQLYLRILRLTFDRSPGEMLPRQSGILALRTRVSSPLS